MKKQLFILFTFVFLLICPVNAQAAEQKNPIKNGTFQVDMRNITQPVSIQSDNRNAVSAASASIASTGNKKQVNLIYKALKGYKTTINVQGYGINQYNLADILNRALDKDYYLFDSIRAFNGISYAVNYTSTNFVQLRFKYIYSKATMKKRYSKLKSTVTAMKKSIGTNLTKEQAALAVHDAIIKRATYNMPYANKVMYSNFTPTPSQYSNHSAYGILVGKKGVCDGYAYAYRLFMKAYGIPCVFASSDSMRHAWNMIKLGGNWYHIDVTWDDPDAASNWTGNGSGDLITYSHFLLNNNEIQRLNHYGWTPYYNSTSTAYSSMPRNTSNFQVGQKGYWYFWERYTDSSYRFIRSNLKGSKSSYKIIADSVNSVALIKNRYHYVRNYSVLYSINKNGTARRDITALAKFAPGTRFTIAGVNGSTLRLQYITDNAAGESGYRSLKLSAYDTRTTDKATSLKISASKKVLKAKRSFWLNFSVGPSWASSKKAAFKSSNPKIASVSAVGSSRGKITAKKKGKATITVSVPGTSLKKTCQVTVK